MANEFKIKHGFISTGNGEVQGTLDVSTGININAQPVATKDWVTGTALASYATSQDVTDAINALVDSAPGTLNTLNELAAALGDDASFSTTITNSIATKLPLAGGTMSGDIKILYNDHASGAGYDTQLYIGKSDTLGLQGAFPTYVPAGSYGFFSHASSDGVFFGSVPVSAGASNYYATIAWGDDATEYLQFLYKGSQKAYLTTDGHFYIDGSFYSNGAIVATQAWVSAQSFITGYTETDPVFSASAAAGVTTALIDKWNDAFSWGNHADGGYLAASSYTAADILTKIKTVDGAGSGLDADYIDGLTSSQFLRSDAAGILTYNTSTSETLKFANNTSGGLIQLGFQQNDADGMHHRAYLKAYKSAAGSVAGKFDIVIRSIGGGTTNDVFELEASSKAKWRGENLATETFASDEAAAVQDNLDSLVGSLGTAAYTASTAYAPASHTHSYLPLSGGTLTGALVVPRVQLTNSTSNDVGNRITVYESGATSYGMMLWNDNATSGEWATMIYGPNQSNRKISFGKANANFPGTKDSVDELAYIDLDNGNFVATGTLSASGYNASNWDTAYGWGDHAGLYGSAGDTAKGVEAFGWGDHAAAGYLTSYSESDTLATVSARGNTTNGSINVKGDILLTGGATTTNQARTIDFTGFDKEGTTDFSDRAYIQHTVNTGGHAGSVLVISSQNDSTDGIAFLTNASSKLKHNSNNIATENWVAAQGYLTSLPAHTHPISEIDGLQDELDGKQPAGSYLTTSGKAADSNLLDGLDSSAFLQKSGGTMTGVITTPNGTHGIIVGDDSRLADRNVANTLFLEGNQTNTAGYINFGQTTGAQLGISGAGAALTWKGNNIWHAGNDGAGSGLDADTLDGLQASDFGSAGDTAKGLVAFGWGDHSAAGYITDGNTNWNNSYGFITASDSITGNAATATKLATARSIALAGDVTGSANFDGSANISITATVANDSHTHDGRYYTESESDARFVNVTGDTVTGNLAVSGATLSVTSTAAGSEAFYVDGVNGRLFTISDDLSDSLFSVNTISGLPVIEAFADNTVKIGPFSNPVTVDSSGVLAIGGVTAATQTYVDNAISGLIGGAPGALDTLNELAAAINDDASYASTITTALGTKAPLASPALTGTPTAPTAAAATNNTQIATTAFVKAQGYLTSYSETDTLATVTGRGASTSTDLTLSGRVTFNSAVVDRPQMPGGFLGIDTGDSNFDIWGISRDYYPSHATAANAWGLEWYGDGNQFRFVGNGTRVITLDMDNGNIVTNGTLSASGYNKSNWDTAYGWGNHASAGYAASSHNHTSLTGVTSIGFSAQSSDSASITTTISGTSTFFDFNLTDDNNNDWWRWRFTPSGSTVYDAMTLKPVSNGNADLTVSGSVFADNLAISNWNTAYGWGNHASAGYLTTETYTAHEDTSTLSGQYGGANNGVVIEDITVDSNGHVTAVGTRDLDGRFDSLGSAATAESNAVAHADDRIDNEVIPSIPTNNNQLTNGAGYITGYTETDTLATVIGRGNLFGTANQGYITANGGTYGSDIRKIRRITMTAGSSNWDGDNHCIISTDSAGNLADSLSINSYNDITLRIDTNSNNDVSYVRFGQHGTGASTYYFVSGYNGAEYITTITGNVLPSTDRMYNLGEPENRWRIVFCETLDSAGLHESNLASDTTGFHATGTVLVWKDGEAVPCTTEADHMKIGVAVFGNSSPLVQGAEPVLVSGEVTEGDYLITSEVVGHAKAVSRSYVIENQLLDCVIGKALETASGESHLVKTWVTI